MKVNELTGAALDWAVALIEFPEPDYEDDDRLVYVHGDDEFHFTPSTNWAQGGPIIEREGVEVRYRVGVNMTATIGGQHEQTAGYKESTKPMLLAAMRCYVASKLGDEVEIPEALV